MSSLKKNYHILKISRNTAKILLDKYHYLHEEGNFRSGINFGLFENQTNLLIGVIVFHTNSAKGIIKGCFGINSFKLDGFYELGRLCMNPHKHVKNLTSYFLGNSIKLLRKIRDVKCILTYADKDYHVGYVYQACNFLFTGLSADRVDKISSDNKHSRHAKDATQKIRRSRKYRYVYFVGSKQDKKKFINLLRYEVLPYPKGDNKKYDAGGQVMTQPLLFA